MFNGIWKYNIQTQKTAKEVIILTVVTGTIGKASYIARIKVTNFDVDKAKAVLEKHKAIEFAAHLARLDREQ